ncbi:hypothetical protein Tco_1423419, partial [Tanacetum coccineum]
AAAMSRRGSAAVEDPTVLSSYSIYQIIITALMFRAFKGDIVAG